MGILKLLSSKTPQFKDNNGEIIPDSIALLEKVKLGGVTQTILIRGVNKNHPILLFLHGGPGVTAMALSHEFDKILEQHFIVVNWDQRGSGKSFSKDIPENRMSIEQILSDLYELIQYLREKFNKEKILLVGHSWGTIIGLKIVKKYPELFHAFISVGQVVDLSKSEPLSYDFALNEAKRAKNKKAIKQLESIKPYDYSNSKHTNIQRKWLTKYGGMVYGRKNLNHIIKKGFSSPEYNFSDLFKFIKGIKFSMETLWKEVTKTNFFKEITEIKIPIFFFQGRNDYNTVFSVVEEYYNILKAPKKEIIWFENSAHMPNYEENRKYSDLIISKILPEIK